MQHDKIPDLIETLTRSKSHSRNLDAEIATVLGHEITMHQAQFTMERFPAIEWQAPHPYVGMIEPCPNFTSSIDASLRIAKQNLPGAYYILAQGKASAKEPIYGCQFLFGTDEVMGEGEHNVNECFAILIALFMTLLNQHRAQGSAEAQA